MLLLLIKCVKVLKISSAKKCAQTFDWLLYNRTNNVFPNVENLKHIHSANIQLTAGERVIEGFCIWLRYVLVGAALLFGVWA